MADGFSDSDSGSAKYSDPGSAKYSDPDPHGSAAQALALLNAKLEEKVKLTDDEFLRLHKARRGEDEMMERNRMERKADGVHIKVVASGSDGCDGCDVTSTVIGDSDNVKVVDSEEDSMCAVDSVVNKSSDDRPADKSFPAVDSSGSDGTSRSVDSPRRVWNASGADKKLKGIMTVGQKFKDRFTAMSEGERKAKIAAGRRIFELKRHALKIPKTKSMSGRKPKEKRKRRRHAAEERNMADSQQGQRKATCFPGRQVQGRNECESRQSDGRWAGWAFRVDPPPSRKYMVSDLPDNGANMKLYLSHRGDILSKVGLSDVVLDDMTLDQAQRVMDYETCTKMVDSLMKKRKEDTLRTMPDTLGELGGRMPEIAEFCSESESSGRSKLVDLGQPVEAGGTGMEKPEV